MGLGPEEGSRGSIAARTLSYTTSTAGDESTWPVSYSQSTMIKPAAHFDDLAFFAVMINDRHGGFDERSCIRLSTITLCIDSAIPTHGTSS